MPEAEVQRLKARLAAQDKELEAYREGWRLLKNEATALSGEFFLGGQILQWAEMYGPAKHRPRTCEACAFDQTSKRCPVGGVREWTIDFGCNRWHEPAD